MSKTPSTYRAAIADRTELKAELERMVTDFAKASDVVRDQIRDLDRIIAITEAGVDPDDYLIARGILRIKWFVVGFYGRQSTPEVIACFRAARQDLQQGLKYLRLSYFGVKEYDQFSSQREDHGYGYGPTYGHIWFSIGLVGDAESRRVVTLSDEMIVACIRWLDAVQANPNLLDL